MLLNKLACGQRKVVQEVTGCEKVKRFLSTLGCYEGAEITLISILSGNYVVNIKNSRYALDGEMAKSIILMD